MISSFPKIFSIGTDYIKDIFNEPVEITEKIGGSQFSFGVIDGELQLRSKGARLYPGNCDGIFQEAVSYIQSIEHKLIAGYVYYCEYMKRPKHNALKYDRTPKNHLVLFGCKFNSSETFLPYEDLVHISETLNIDVVPLIYKGKMNGNLIMQYADDFLGRDSYLGGCKIEGFVVKNYERKFLLGGQPMPLMAGKYVSEAFKEVHKAKWDGEKSSSKLELFYNSFCTEARWQKAIQHLDEKGELTHSHKDIGSLIHEIGADIIKEEAGYIKEWLFNEFMSHIKRSATRGFPEFYKKYLLERSINAG